MERSYEGWDGCTWEKKTWDLVELSQGKQLVGYKWAFTVKHKVDGSLERYKDRLVVKGYAQTLG